MNTKELRSYWYNLTQKDISEIFDIPLRTVENWDLRSSAPDYVITMMNRLLAKEDVSFGDYLEEIGEAPNHQNFKDFCLLHK